MNERERFIQALSFGNPDRIPFEPGWPRESTLRAWQKQGLAEDQDWQHSMSEILGFPFLTAGQRVDPGVDFRMIPHFEEKVLEHRDGHYIVQDWMGAVTEISDSFDYTYLRSARDFVTRKWHRFPVKSPQDWYQNITWRYQVDTPGRFPEDFPDRGKALHGREYPLRLAVNGPFWQLREWCGFEGLCTFMIEAPGFVEEMVEFWQKFVLEVFRRLLEVITPDFVMVNEDMAYKLHSMISPRMVRRFLLPTWISWVDHLKSRGVPLVFIDSDGYIAELIPLWIEAGFDGNYPVEVAAGNDIVSYRKLYAHKMAYLGGIDKRSINMGGELMRAEVLRVVPPLLEQGGFIPGCDHGVPPDISWANFLDYARLLAQLTGWIK